MSPRRVRRFALWIIAAVLVATLLPPFINANRFRNKLVDTISRSIGRPVSMGDLHFSLLPRPGFVINNLVISDDPAFSSEPILRAESVNASLRITSLWGGRLEISRLSFDYPSLNLVRSADGRWNVESILRQASQVPAAPTATPRPQERPRFPYIEAANGRINFRQGQEKLAHALMEADFSLWLEAEDQWNMRLEARPTRTDTHLSDTGLLHLVGEFRRAETLAATPVRLDLELENAQVGQWSSLLTGRDHGWRGSTDLQAKLQGTVRDLNFEASAEISDFHRHDIANPDSLDGSIACKGKMSRDDTTSKAVLDCSAPLGKGSLNIAGQIALSRDPDLDLNMTFRDASVASFADLFRRIKRDVPEDLHAEGTFNGVYRVLRDRSAPSGSGVIASGTGRVTGMQLDSESRNASLFFSPFDVEFPQAKKATVPAVKNQLVIGATGVRLGGAVPVYVSAKVSPTAIVAEAKGDADLNQMLVAASVFGLADPRYKATGLANINMAVHGTYAEFSAPVVTGTAQLRQVTTQVDGVAAPLLVRTATLLLLPEAATVQKLSAQLEGTNTLVEGSLTIPRNCSSTECASNFDLKTAELNIDDLNRILNPRYRSSDWLSLPLQIFGGKAVKASRLMTLQSHGTIAIGRLTVKNLVANRVTGLLTFNKGRIDLENLEAELLSGKHKGAWHADLSGAEPLYTGSGVVETLPVTQLNSLLRSPLGSGTLRLTYDLSLQGADAASLRHSAAGSGVFRWANGSWRTTGSSSSVQFSDWSGALTVRDEVVDVTGSVMQTRGGPYQVSGQATFDRGLSLRLSGARDQVLISGTVQEASLAVQAAEAVPARDSASNQLNVPQKAAPSKSRN